jgi:nucleotide-binding universal stress UspA family protein
MFLSYFTLLTALSLSVVAAWYSILGLTAIFASAVIPIIIMGSILEVAKVTVTVWLHEYWHRCRWLMKCYLVPAVGMLMVITSMGIFGFLSKAHSDQNLISGDAQSKIAIYDEKIKTQKENIESNRKVLKQMDEGVDSVLGRSADEKGADKAVALRRAQQKERIRLQNEILQSQKSIAELNDARAPIAAEVRKIDAEVGPIKYIAAFIYGDNPDANLLERAVRWVIIILVVVFDPLAIMMVLASTESMKWERERRLRPAYEPDDGPLTEEQIEQLRKIAELEQSKGEVVETSKLFDDPPKDPHPPGWMYDELKSYPLNEAEVEEVVEEFKQVRRPVEFNQDYLDAVAQDIEQEDHDNPGIKAAIKQWKSENPDRTIKEERAKLVAGRIQELPWMGLIADNELGREPTSGFGIGFPASPVKGDTYMRVDQMPNVLYKFNGFHWIIVDKNLTDNYTYDDAYIEHLIAQLSSGEYDPDMLSDAEADAIARRVKPI